MKSFKMLILPLCKPASKTGCVQAWALAVQVFRGVHWSDDVLNHENIGFWHYLQPAYNVMGFISCAGTNFLLRSTPFAQAGSPPEPLLVLQPFLTPSPCREGFFKGPRWSRALLQAPSLTHPP